MAVTKKQFKELYFKNTNADLADILDVSESTIKAYAKKLGLSKGRGNRVNHKRKFNF